MNSSVKETAVLHPVLLSWSLTIWSDYSSKKTMFRTCSFWFSWVFFLTFPYWTAVDFSCPMSKGFLGYYLEYLEYSGDFQLCYGEFCIPSLGSLNVLCRTEIICSRNRHLTEKLHLLTVLLDLTFCLLELQIDIWKSAVRVSFLIIRGVWCNPIRNYAAGK